MFRPAPDVSYEHLDELFTAQVDWDLIATLVPDMMRVAVSIRTGNILPSDKSVKLTEAGRVFLKQSRTVLSCAADAVKAAQAADGDGKRELQVGYVPSLTVTVLSHILRAFGKKAPAVRVNLHDMTTPDMIAAVREGQLDAAFVTRHPSDRIRGVTFEPLRLFRVGVMVSKGHRFARKRSIAAADVLTEPFAVFSRKEYAIYHKWLRSLFGARSWKPWRLSFCARRLGSICKTPVRILYCAKALD